MVSAIPMQSATLHRFHSTTTGSRPIASPPASWPTQVTHQPKLTSTLSSKKALELGTLRPTLDRPFAFVNPSASGFPASVRSTLIPLPVSQQGQEPIPTFQSSDGCLTLRPTKSARRFALSDESAVFQVFVACLPSRLTHRQTLTLNISAVTLRLVVRTRLSRPRTPTFPDHDSIFQDTHSQA
jgi:hypothetical protein